MKDDLISRQAAIKYICTMLKNCFNATDEMLESVKITVGEMPYVPDTNVGDMISRQTALNRFEPWLKVKGYSDGELNMLKAVLCELREMPSAQPEIIHCKDCKFFSHGYCRFHDAKFVRPDGYCYWGGQKDGEAHD